MRLRSGLNPGRIAFALLVAVSFAFLLAPVLLVIPMSLSADNTLTWPPSGWSLRWFRALLAEPALVTAFANSALLATIVTVLSLAAGLPAALALSRSQFRGREAITTMLTLPLLLPSVVLGLALLIIFVGRGLVGSWAGLMAAHLLVTLPYSVRVLMTAAATLPPSVEDAAASLGASPARVLWRVTLPLMGKGVVAAAAISFLISFDEVVISLFVVGPQLNTLPVALFHYVEARTDPLVAAVSALMILLTLTVVVVLERALGLKRTVGDS
jgi:putative spermidine/putrescine transport system permease protein